MPGQPTYDAVIVGSGPNGLAAAITLARAGHSVLVYEARETVGGGTRTEALTLPGFQHDVCSAIHPLGVSSPFMQTLALEAYGLEWDYPPVSVAHPLDDGGAVLLERSVEATAERLGLDGPAYRRLFNWLISRWQDLVEDTLNGVPILPRHPLLLARFGLQALQPATWFADRWFKGELARALFAGNAAHSMLPLNKPITTSFGLVMMVMAHTVGWPLARGGSQKITQAMAAYLQSLGGEIVVNHPVECLDELPPARLILLDLAPRQILRIAGKRLPAGYRQRLERYRYGVGIFKVDYALSGPIPWKNPEIARTAAVHLGGTLEEVASAEQEVWRGGYPDKPFVLLAQQSLFDASRAPQGKHTAWAYCHVPNGSTVDMTERIDAQIERFAPGFRDLVLARHTRNSMQTEAYNPNFVGGDINAGAQDLAQFFTRPVPSLVPYRTPAKGIYICSASTPPGGGVHGMCGYNAARAAIKELEAGR